MFAMPNGSGDTLPSPPTTVALLTKSWVCDARAILSQRASYATRRVLSKRAGKRLRTDTSLARKLRERAPSSRKGPLIWDRALLAILVEARASALL